MKMGHTPYGYKIENGKAVIDNEAVSKIQKQLKVRLNLFILTHHTIQAVMVIHFYTIIVSSIHLG